MKRIFIFSMACVILWMGIGSLSASTQGLDCSQELGLPAGFDCEVFVITGQSANWHLDFDTQGNLFVSNDWFSVLKIAPDGTIKTSAPISDPDGVAVDSQDRVFVAGDGRITIVNSFEGGSDIIFATGFANLDAIAIDSQDNMVVLDGEHYVKKIFKETGAIELLYTISGQGFGPGWSSDVEFSANDELYSAPA